MTEITEQVGVGTTAVFETHLVLISAALPTILSEDQDEIQANDGIIS